MDAFHSYEKLINKVLRHLFYFYQFSPMVNKVIWYLKNITLNLGRGKQKCNIIIHLDAAAFNNEIFFLHQYRILKTNHFTFERTYVFMYYMLLLAYALIGLRFSQLELYTHG